LTDAELLRRVKCGDGSAWRILYARCLPAVWRYTFALCDDHIVAEDVVSETMLALVRGLDSLDPATCHVHGWLRRVARNKLVDLGREVARRQRLYQEASRDPRRSVPEMDPTDPLEAAETRSRVLEILDRLTDIQCTVLEWKYLDNLSVREIAERLDATEKSAESVLYRARREFRRLYNLADRHDALPRERDWQSQDR
jgi:RNA polymerase sigma factor (sigma-70 family)